MMLVAIFQARFPYHDAMVKQCTVAFFKGGHFLHHVSKLIDVECCEVGGVAARMGSHCDRRMIRMSSCRNVLHHHGGGLFVFNVHACAP